MKPELFAFKKTLEMLKGFDHTIESDEVHKVTAQYLEMRDVSFIDKDVYEVLDQVYPSKEVLELITKLKSYGKLEKCEFDDGEFRILITDGFISSGRRTFDLMRLVGDTIGGMYSTVGDLITRDNYCKMNFREPK
jgi:hypothetical protein